MGIFFKEPTDFGAMSMDELCGAFQEGKEKEEKLRRKKKKLDKTVNDLGKADKGLKLLHRFDVFGKIGGFIRSKQKQSETETETTE